MVQQIKEAQLLANQATKLSQQTYNWIPVEKEVPVWLVVIMILASILLTIVFWALMDCILKEV